LEPGTEIVVLSKDGTASRGRVRADRGEDFRVELEGGRTMVVPRAYVRMPDGSPLAQLERRILARLLNRALCGMPIVFAGLGFVLTASLAGAVAWLFFGIAITCVVLLAEWALLTAGALFERGTEQPLARRRFTQLVPALPFLERFGQNPLPWLAIGGLALALFAAREHAFGDTLAYDVEWWSGELDSDSHRSLNHSSQSSGGDAPWLGGHPLYCTASCTPAGDICDAALVQFGCTHRAYAEPDATHVSIWIQHDGYRASLLPLSTSSEVELDVDASLEASNEFGSRRAFLQVHTTLEHQLRGLHSWWSERQLLGRKIGQVAVAAIDDVLAEH
jgi:hypothetical protein